MSERMLQAESRSLERRREVLATPMVPLRLHGFLGPPEEERCWSRRPRAVGIGPDDSALALWDHHDPGVTARLVTWHGAQSGRAAVVVGCARPADFVQPLPDGQVLLVEARSRGGSRGGENAEVRSDEGVWLRGGHLGNGVQHVLATPRGDIWAGYSDEGATSGRGLGGHGLVRFGPDLHPRWQYPYGTDLPVIADCQALNLTQETALVSVYKAPHVVSVRGEDVTDHGRMPTFGASAVLVDGEDALVVGGLGADYDLVTPVRIAPDGLRAAGPVTRLVLPDGMEIRDATFTGRGAELHVVIGSRWYRASLDGFPREA